MTERTPLRGNPGPQYDPQYVFTMSGRRYRNRIRQFQCCVCATVLACFVLAIVVSVAYSVNKDNEEVGNSTNSSAEDVLVSLLSLNFPLPDPDNLTWPDIISAVDMEEALNMGQDALTTRDLQEKTVPRLPQDSPSYRHQMAVRTGPEATRLSRAGFVLDAATTHLLTSGKLNGSVKPMGRGPTVTADWMPDEACADDGESPCPATPYRSNDGTCNNPIHPYKWGVAMRPFRRSLPPDYGDGVSAPRVSSDGSSLPSARTVSVTVHRPMYRDDPHFTVMLAVWGQFLDHDVTATALNVASDGGAISCCGSEARHPECFPVMLETGDAYYHQFNLTCMNFVRSAPAPVCSLGPREQLNQASAFLDGSTVYGPNLNLTNQLRTMQGGRLRMFITPDGRNLLPQSSETSDGCNEQQENARGRYCFLSGDARSNENLHLTTMHLLWARQHNLVADSLSSLNPHWTDEQVFQEARRIVIAQLQHITYSEFLPVLLGDKLMSRLDLKPQREGYYHGYDASVDASIANHFASSAFRFGHTLLPGLMKMIKNGSEEYVELHRMLFNPYSLYNPGRLDATIRGAMTTKVKSVDPYFTTELTEHLFEKAGAPCGLDLVSLNIQRGRDHGLPSYPAWREKCGLERPASFADMKKYVDSDALRRISELYQIVEDIDLYTGGLAEKPLTGGFLGPTITCLLVDQFVRLKRGDRFWYETPEAPQAFTAAQLTQLRKSSLARIICDNADAVKFAQAQVMRSVGPGNRRMACSDVEQPDLSPWKELPRVQVPALMTAVRVLVTSQPMRLGGSVTSARAVLDSGETLWDGQLPLAIPTGTTFMPQWSATLDGSQLEGPFSLPVNDQWLNGVFSFQISQTWNQTAATGVSGTFISPVYLKEVAEPVLSNSTQVSQVKGKWAASPSVRVEQSTATAQLVLEGSYSGDRKLFWWNGGFILTLPASDPEQRETFDP